LDISGFGNAAWNRLKIITSEDIGLAGGDAPVQILRMYKEW